MQPVTQIFPFPKIKVLELSHSSRGLLRSCPRKLEFRKIYNNSRKQESLASGAGSALHDGVQSYLQDKDEEQAIWRMIRSFPIKYQKSWMDQNSLAGCYHTLQSMLQWPKLHEYELAKIKKQDGSIVPAVEVPFVLRINNYPFYENGDTIQVDYIGFMDLIMYNKMDDEYIVWDMKTTTKNTDKAVEFAFHDQCLPYGLALESLLGRDTTFGFQVAYWSTYIDHLQPKNMLYSFNKSHVDINDWMQGYLFDLDTIRRYYNLGWFARTGNCMAWNRPCQFFDFCGTRDPKTIEILLEADAANQKEHEKPEPWAIIELEYKE